MGEELKSLASGCSDQKAIYKFAVIGHGPAASPSLPVVNKLRRILDPAYRRHLERVTLLSSAQHFKRRYLTCHYKRRPAQPEADHDATIVPTLLRSLGLFLNLY